MTVKDIKTFLEQFDENEEIEDVEFYSGMDICDNCDDYCYDDYYENCACIRECSECRKHKDYKQLSFAFKSDVSEDGCIYQKDYHELIIEDPE